MRTSKLFCKNCLLSVVAPLALAISGWLATATRAWAQEQPPIHSEAKFDLQALAIVPEVFPAEDLQVEGVKAFYYAGKNYHGKPTRIFAYYGAPERSAADAASGKKSPAVVLIHGGGGTAFDRWVKLWNSRGYAAIAMDLCGCIPVGTYGKWERHANGGPPGWDASFGQIDDAIDDQWTSHAVSAVVLAHSLIGSYPEVDRDRIGVTGISWGGYLTCIVAGVDPRFQGAAPVYGCGFLGENSAWLTSFDNMGPEKAKRWLDLWDPSNYLPHAKMPMLWVNGTNDFAYPMDSWKRSAALTPSHSLCLRIRMPHGHGAAGENPEEIHQFMNAILNRGQPLAAITKQGRTDDTLWVEFKAEVPISRAELCYTRDVGKWQDRTWESIPAEMDASQTRAQAKIPDKATAYYLNLYDQRDCAISSEHEEAAP